MQTKQSYLEKVNQQYKILIYLYQTNSVSELIYWMASNFPYNTMITPDILINKKTLILQNY